MNGNKPMGNNPRSTRWEKKDCGSYYHTHGYLVGPKHTSETCRQPGPNHNKQATRQNPMGSNMEGKPTTTTRQTGATCRQIEHTHYSSFTPEHRRPPPPFTRIIDTGTSHHNLALGDGDLQQYVRYTTNAPRVMIPNGANITAQAHYNLQLANVSHKASEADILPSFKHSLLSVGQLCDDNCTAIFSKNKCTIYNKRNEPVITGIHNHSMGLYEQSSPGHQQPNYLTGQCHITNNEPPRTYQISSSMCLLSNTSNMDPGREKGPFQNLARCHRRRNPTIPTKIRGNHNGTFRPTKKEHTINKITEG